MAPRKPSYTPSYQRAPRLPAEYTIEQLHELLGISKSTLKYQCANGMIDARKGRRRDNREGWLIPEQEVERLQRDLGLA